MLRGFALFFGVVFILMGVIGFIPFFARHQLLFNWLAVGSVNNIFYVLTGLIGLSASRRVSYTRLYFKALGVLYALIAILGFALNGQLGFLQVNLADSFLHLFVAVIALYLGFTSTASARSRFA